MPSILNIANINNENKASSKTNFNIGEKFSGKLVKDNETGEIKVKLRDGIEIPAEIEGNSKFIDKDKLIKFEIKGFENGKLKLKVVNPETSSLKKQEEEIEGFIKQQGLAKEDSDIVKSMIKHDMNLSREKILKVRTLLNFKGDVKENKEEVNKFINSFLKSKGISRESQEGQKIVKVLNNFFEKLGSLKSEELLTMLENNMELNDKSIESFLKLIKENGQTLKNLKKVLKIQNDPKSIVSVKQGLENGINIKELKIEKEDILGLKKQVINDLFKKNISIENKEMDSIKAEIKISSKVAENTKLEDNRMKNALKDVLLSKNSEGILKDPIKILTNLKNLTEESIINKLETLSKEESISLSNMDKNKIENIISSMLGENIPLKEEEIENIKTIFNNIMGISNKAEENKSKKDITKVVSQNTKESNNEEIEKNLINTQDKNIENINKDSLESNNLKNLKAIKSLSKEAINLKNSTITIENQIKEKCSEIKSLVKEIINKGENLAFNIPKETINDLKVMNSLNNSYYMLDLPLKLNEREMDCKLMIKDDRKSGKKIDSKNVKLVVTVDTINMGKIDGYLKVVDNNLSIDLRCNEKWIKPISLGKSVLLESLNSMGYSVNVSVSKRVEEANISTCREFFNDKTILVLDRIV